jgi:PAS domain S-box-containing protein
MLCIAGFDGYFKHVNPAWERTLGWTAEELTSRPWTDFVHPDDLESTVAEAAKQTEQGLEVISFENRYRAKDGTYHWLLWSSRPSAERGEMHAVARDISERKQSEQALVQLNQDLETRVSERTAEAESRASQAEEARRELAQREEQIRTGADRMRSFLQQMPIAAAVVGRDMRYLFLTDRFRTEYGLQDVNVFTISHTDIFPDQDERWKTILAGCLAGEAQASDEERFTVQGGRHEWLRWRADPWRLQTGEIAGMLLYVETITARKEAEDRVQRTSVDLARSNAEMEAFTYSVSHDLKEPLRTIEAFSQFLLEDYADRLDDEGRDYLLKLARASARMKQLIEDLLALSRIGRRDERTSSCDVGRVLSDILEGMRATVDERSARVEVQEGLPHVVGSPARIEQIFGNLISNAIKFNRSDAPSVEVGLRELTSSHAVFFVRDNGIGIEPEYHERIFGIFQRLQRREEFEGTGAGLAIVKRAVETLGGTIAVESDGSSGTTFIVSLPLAAAGEERQAA